MTWIVEWDDSAVKELRKLDKQTQRDILQYFRTRIENKENPQRFGKALTHDKAGLWRYRLGDYRMICSIKDKHLIVLVLRVGHRKKIYK